jgi:predicted nucleic acid-binding protein
MTVVCDTSPLCYLILIDYVEVLPQLFGRVTIPNAVCTELLAEGSYTQVQNWIAQPPSWLQIQTTTPLLPNLSSKLGIGEQEAISLAVQLNAALIILDDLDARQTAIALFLNVTGLLGVLYRAGTQGIIDFPHAISKLQLTSFRASSALIQSFLERYHQRSQ